MNERVIANIKSLGMDMISNANSGHPGIVLGAAPIIYTLYLKHLNISTSDPKWVNRDRFVMSAGHGSALLYSTLFMTGFNISLEELKRFRHSGSKTPGHPEVDITPGVDMSTGPLGQGFASAVGMAISERMLNLRTTVDGISLIDHKVYVLCGDGDLMEGISYEAASMAGSLGLNNLIVLYDSNNISLDGTTNMTFNEDIHGRFKSMGWDTELVKNGNDINAIDKAITKAKMSKKPTLIEVKTVIGSGSFLEGTNTVHGKPLTNDDLSQLKSNLNITATPFFVDEEARNYFRRQVAERSNVAYSTWAEKYKTLYNSGVDMKSLGFLFNKNLVCNFLDYDFKFEIDMKEATRVTNKKVMNEISKYIPYFVGGSADLASATNAYLEGQGDIIAGNFAGKNLRFGVREHAMGAILNGMALDNFRVFGSTFLCFSDYLKPAIRMSALMNLPVTYIFSHDSILVGQDGPTHQPIEQLTQLRATPNLNVYRPCDPNELVGCWNSILNTNDKPSCLILSRTDVPYINTSNKKAVENGAYIIRKEINKLDGIIIATGTEVSTAIYLANNIYKEANIDLRVVSMPCQEKFDAMDVEYQNMILPINTKIFTLEAGSSYSWYKYATNKEYVLGIDKFGVSGTKDEVLQATAYDFNTLKVKIIELINKV